MSDARIANTHTNADATFLVTHDDDLSPDAIEQIDFSTLAPSLEIPHLDSVKQACDVLEALLKGPQRTLSCTYKLDGLQFGEMRSSVLRAGIAVLAARAGHQAIVAPSSAQLPTAHWRSEFIFRAVRGIRLIKPDLSEQELLRIVTREIHFYIKNTSHGFAHDARQRERTHQNVSAAR